MAYSGSVLFKAKMISLIKKGNFENLPSYIYHVCTYTHCTLLTTIVHVICQKQYAHAKKNSRKIQHENLTRGGGRQVVNIPFRTFLTDIRVHREMTPPI